MTFLSGVGSSAGSSGLPTTVGSITAVGTPLALTSANVNAGISLLSTVRWGTVKLPAANTSGFTAGPVNFPINAHSNSQIIKVKNGGTEGTDATLEAILLPGVNMNLQLRSNTASTYFGAAYTAAAGVWDKQALLSGATYTNLELPKMIVPISPGAAPPRLDLGAASTLSATNQNTRVPLTAMLTGLLGVSVWIDSSNNVQGLPFQMSADGVTNQVVGTKTQIQANGGNTLQYPIVTKIDATRALVTWWDNTNTKNGYVIITLTPGALPSAPTFAVGTAIDDTAIATAAQRIVKPGYAGSIPVLDFGGPNFWHIGLQVSTGTTTRCRAYYFSVAGAVITFSANADYDTSAGGVSVTDGGIVPGSFAATKAMVPGSGGNSVILRVIQFSGGAITIIGSIFTNQLINFGTFNGTPSICAFYPIDITNGVWVILSGANYSGNNAGNALGLSLFAQIVKLDLTGYALLDSWHLGYLVCDRAITTAMMAPYPGQFIPIGQTGEFIALNIRDASISGGRNGSDALTNRAHGYVDFGALYRDFSTMNTMDTGFVAQGESAVQVRALPWAFGSFGTTNGFTATQFNLAVDPTTRRVILNWVDTFVASGNQNTRFQFCEIPRR